MYMEEGGKEGGRLGGLERRKGGRERGKREIKRKG